MLSKIKTKLGSLFRFVFALVIILSMTINFKTNIGVEAVNLNLKYFGYFNDYDDGSKSIPNGFAELGNLNNSNIVHFNLSSTNVADNQYFLNKAKLANLKTLPGIQEIFGKYYADTTTNYTDQDFENSFSLLEDTLKGYEDQVLALYVQDEPNFDGIRESKFVDLTLRLKNRFPNYRRLITFAYPQLINTGIPGWLPATSTLISNITDVGFDGYKFTGFLTTNAGRQPYVTALANIANQGQNLWLVPDAVDAQPRSNCVLGNGSPDKVYLADAMEDYYQLALNNPRVVGMYNFLWDVREIPGLDWIDSRRMFDSSDPCYSPTVKQKHIDIGQAIISNVDITAPTKPITITKTTTTFSGTAEVNSRIKGYNPAGNIVCDVVVSSTGTWTCQYPNTGQLVKFFAVDNSDNWSQPESFNPNLEYFGYWNGDNQPNNATSFSSLGNSNMVMLPFGDSNSSIQYFRDRLTEVKAANLKAIIGIDFRFIEYIDGNLTFTEQEFERRMKILEDTISGNEDIIYAFEIEECNIICGNYVGANFRFNNLMIRLKNRFPNIGRMAVLAYPQLDGSDPNAWGVADSALLANLTDVSFDRYPYEYNRNSNVANYNIILQHANQLTAMANNNQKLWLLPDSSVISNCTGGTTFLETAIYTYNNIANLNSRFVGLLPYLWSIQTGTPDITAKQLFEPTDSCYNENLKNKHIQIGQSIKNMVDTTSPSKPLISTLTGGPTSYILTGTAEASSTIKMFDELGTQYCQATVSTNGLYTCSFNVVAGSTNKLKMFATDRLGNNSQLTRINLNGNCEYKILPAINSAEWGNTLNALLCQSIVTDSNSADIGKLRSDLASITDTGKAGIGTNNPSTSFAVVGLNEYISESLAISAGLKNGDFYRTGTQVKVVVGGAQITDNLNSLDSDCSPSSSNRLPTINGDGGEWGNILNHFLCISRFNNSTSPESGKLKTDLAAITQGGKVGIGATPSNLTKFAIKDLPNILNIPFAGTGSTYLQNVENNNLKNGDVYQNNGLLQVVNSPSSSNITTPNSDDCYQSTVPTRLPKSGQDNGIWGELINNFLCKTILNGPTNSGKLKTDLGSIVQGGKVGIGTNNPNSVLAIVGIPNYVNNTTARASGLLAGDIYRTDNDVKIVF